MGGSTNKMDKIQELRTRRTAIEATAKTARERIQAILDPESFVETGAFVKARSTDFNGKAADVAADGVVTGYGTIEERLVFVFSQDAASMGGSVGEMHAQKIASLIKRAMESGAPVVGILDSEGLRLTEQIDAAAGYGKIYAALAKASGVVPTIAVVAGTAAGGAALIPGLCDFTVMTAKDSKLFVSSANAMEKGTSFDQIASGAVHAEKTGLADFVCDDFEQAAGKVRALVDMIPANNEEDAPIYDDRDDLNRVSETLDAVASAGMDILPVIAELADAGDFLEVRAAYGKSMVTGFMRLNGGTIGVVANNGAVDGGRLTTAGCWKASAFIRFCDAYELPVLAVVDTEGFAVSKEEENAGLAQAAAALTGAFAGATVPKVTLVAGKAYGSAAMVMNSKENGADVVLAWPEAEFAVMNPQSEARILYADEIAAGADLAEKTEAVAALQTAFAAASRGSVDDIIEPSVTRKHLLVNFGMLAGKQKAVPTKKRSTLL